VFKVSLASLLFVFPICHTKLFLFLSYLATGISQRIDLKEDQSIFPLAKVRVPIADDIAAVQISHR
jgi:hypothetical protein